MSIDRRTALRLTGGALVGLALPRRPAAACRVFPADGTTDFMVLRQDRVVGRHAIRFTRRDERFIVRTDVEMEIGPVGVPGYRFVHHAEEIWVDGWLHALVSDTNDDGRLYRLRAERRDGIFGGIVNGMGFTVSGYLIPTSLWHRDTPATQVLFDTIDALTKVVQGRLVGTESVPVVGHTVPAKHYTLRGEINRDLWYDEECSLVRVAYVARDGSPITLEPR